MSKTRLLKAVKAGDVPTAFFLLEDHRDVTERGKNLLHLAASRRRNLPMVRMLVVNGFDADARLDAGDCEVNPVWFSVAHGRDVTVAKYLLEHGGAALGLFAATWHQDLPMIRLLVEHGADREERVHDETPLLHAFKARRFRSVKRLLELGADAGFRDSKGKTALHYAVERNAPLPVVRLLLKHGARPDAALRAQAKRKRDPAYGRALTASA